jgi:predicted transposase YbfD/YdcC
VVDGKSNEGALIPSLLDKLRLKGSLVTIDAAGSYRPIAERIVEAEADYLLTVKANQPKLLAGIKAALAQAAPDTVQRCESVETSHGRQEHRRCTVAPAPAGLGGKTPWAGLKYVAAVEGTFVRSGKLTTLTRYYITSRALTADQLLEAVRGHWSIENSVHWVLDVVFGDDYQRLRSEYGPRNMALVQRIALNLIRRRPSGKDSLTVKRKKAGWSTAYLIETIAAVPA